MKIDPPKFASPMEIGLAVWSGFLSSWKVFLSVSALQIAALPFTLPALLYAFGRFDASGMIVARSLPDPFWQIALPLISTAASAAVAGFAHPALIVMSYMKLIGKPLSIGKALARSKEVFWRYLAVFILMTMAIGAASFLPPVLDLVVSVVIAIYLMFAVQALVLDDRPVFGAFRESVALVRGRFWPTAWRLLAVAGAFAVAAGVITYLLVIKPTDWLDPHLMPVFRQKWLVAGFAAVSVLISTVALPIFLLIQTTFYAELRKHRK